jgi:gas vesicle protein
MNENSYLSNSSSCFFLGVLVGVTGALLFAPLTGADTRRRISSGVSEGGRRLAEKTQDVASGIKHRASKAVETGKGALHSQKDRLNEAVDEGVRAYRSATASV